jgi:hypothetical protein
MHERTFLIIMPTVEELFEKGVFWDKKGVEE